MKYLLGIDFGGGSSKATLLDETGRIVREATAEYPTLHPTELACEQEPADWLRALRENCGTILRDMDPAEVAAVALDSATHTSVVCDEAFRPLRPAIHWTDSRSRAQSLRLREEQGDTLFTKCFHRPDTIWTLPQLLWLREQEPETFKRIRHIFFEKDYIRYFLTGVWCTDNIEAEGSMLFDCRTGKWDAELCALCGLDMACLPPIVAPTDLVGTVTPEAAAETGLAAGTPVICGTTDTVMEVFAAGAIRQGNVTVKLATAGRICVITEDPRPDRHLVTYSHVVPGLWYPGTATKSAAASLRWLRDTFGGTYEELLAGAAKVPIGCDGLMFHPYLNGELTPYADPALCGSFTGIRATHTKAHFTRAVLEGVGFSLMDCKQYLDTLGIPYDNAAILIGGGGKGDRWRRIISDQLGIPLTIVNCSDSSFGSAMLAGIAVGIFADPADAVARCVKKVDSVKPDLEATAQYAALFRRYKIIHDALAPVYGETT